MRKSKKIKVKKKIVRDLGELHPIPILTCTITAMLVSIHQSIGVGWGQTAARLLLALWIWCELEGSWMWSESFVLHCSFVLIGCS